MYDLIVLGGGPAGYLGAERAGHAGLNVLLIESRALGGVCLNEGCIPSKSLLYSAKIFDNARHGEAYGVHTADISLNHKEVIARKNKVVRTLTAGVRKTLTDCGVKIIQETGYIAGRDADGSFRVTAGGETHTGRRLLIATGSEPVLPAIPGLKDSLASGLAMTNREILDLPSVPERLAIVGGGVIGLEMAGYYAAAGAKVTVVEMLDAIGGPIDSDIAVILQKNLAAKGIVFELGAKVISIGAEVIFERGGKQTAVPADKVLVSIGRRPVVAGFGLENIGLDAGAKRIITDPHMQTGIPNAYAAGDVTGEVMLAHVAYRQSETAVNHMLGNSDAMRYDAIPSVIYTSPEVGSVGETERGAREKGLDIEAVKLPMNFSGRYLAENQRGDGICKLIADRRSRRILGCHIIGSYASEIIVSAAMLIDARVTVDRARTMIFPHPTVGEIIREALFALKI